MKGVKKQLLTKGLDLDLWQKSYNRNQKEYKRIRLRAIKMVYEGETQTIVSQILGVSHSALKDWIELYLLGGLDLLCADINYHRDSRLGTKKEQEFKYILTNYSPTDFCIDANIWTGTVMLDFLYLYYGITYKLKGVYPLLNRLKLSHQKAHHDYGNAEPLQAQIFLDELKETILNSDEKQAIVFSDEFSVSQQPSTYYTWAERNTRPKVITNEKKRKD
jgi:transposase